MRAARSCFWRAVAATCGCLAKDCRNFPIQGHRSKLDGVAGKHAGIEPCEPAVIDDDVIVDACIARIGKGCVGHLVHADGARCGLVHRQRVPGQAPAPVGARQRIARSFHLRQGRQKFRRNCGCGVFSEQRRVGRPGFGRHLMEDAAHGKEHLLVGLRATWRTKLPTAKNINTEVVMIAMRKGRGRRFSHRHMRYVRLCQPERRFCFRRARQWRGDKPTARDRDIGMGIICTLCRSARCRASSLDPFRIRSSLRRRHSRAAIVCRGRYPLSREKTSTGIVITLPASAAGSCR